MRKLYFLLLFVIAFFSCHQSSFAAVTLSINAVDGSNSLRFMAAEGYTDKKELRIRVNSTGGKQYQVFQRVNEPLVNEKAKAWTFGRYKRQRSGIPTAPARFICRISSS